MKRFVPASLFVFILLISGCSEQRSFEPADRNFAMEMVKAQCEIVPRHSGTPGAEKTAEWIRDIASSMHNVKVRIDSFSDDTPAGKMTFRNVIAEFPGKGKPIIIGAHYDAKKLTLTPDFQAANDGGSGVAVLLSVMKTVASQKKPFPFPIHFIFFDGEECQIDYSGNDGLHGSKKAAKDYTGKARAMILADMVGDDDWNISIPENCSPELKKIVLQAAAELNLCDSVKQGSMQVLDDHLPFFEAGIPAVNLIDFDYGPGNAYWHTGEDKLDKINPESLGKTADLILKILAIMEKTSF